MKEFQKQLTIPAEVWHYVMDRDGEYCQNRNCINKFGRYSNLTVHHIVPRSQGGAGSDPCNLIVLCWPCHERVELWKHEPGHEDLCITNPLNLIHRDPVPFYDHQFSPSHIKCSHTKAEQPVEEKHTTI